MGADFCCSGVSGLRYFHNGASALFRGAGGKETDSRPVDLWYWVFPARPRFLWYVPYLYTAGGEGIHALYLPGARKPSFLPQNPEKPRPCRHPIAVSFAVVPFATLMNQKYETKLYFLPEAENFF